MSSYPRHRWVILGAIASVMLMTGCPTGTQVKPTDTTTTGTTGNGLGSQVASSNAIKGKVQMPTSFLSSDGKSPAKYELAAISSYKPVVGATVNIRSPRMLVMPNTPKGTTDASGNYSMKGIPVGQVMYVVAEYGGVLAASVTFIPEPTVSKEGGKVVTSAPVEKTVDIDLATTVAAAGILPLFLDADGNVPNELNDLRMEDYAKLVEATAAALNDSFSFKPTKKLVDMEPYFRTLRSSDAAVNQAYLRIEGYLDAARKARYGGGTTGSPNPSGSTNPSASPGASASPSPSASASSSPSPSPSVSVAPKTYDPVIVTSSEAAIQGSISTAQLAFVPNLGTLVPAGDRIQLLLTNGTAGPERVAGVGGVPAFTEATNVVVSGTTAYMVARVGGKFSLLSLDFSNPTAPTFGTPIELTGIEVQSASAIVVSSAPSGDTQGKLLVCDTTRHVVFKVNMTNGQAEVYSGQIDAPNAAEPTTATVPVAQMAYQQPRSIALDATNHKLYVADTEHHRIVELDLVAGTGKKVAGTTIGFSRGSLATAQLKRPTGLWLGTEGRLFVSDTNNHAIRQITVSADEMLSLSTTAIETAAPAANKGLGENLVKSPKGIILVGNNVYVIQIDQGVSKLIKLSLGEAGT